MARFTGLHLYACCYFAERQKPDGTGEHQCGQCAYIAPNGAEAKDEGRARYRDTFPPEDGWNLTWWVMEIHDQAVLELAAAIQKRRAEPPPAGLELPPWPSGHSTR